MTTTTPQALQTLVGPKAPATLGWASQLAAELIEHYLGYGWSFQWDRAQRRRGCTHWDTKTITLSRPLTPRRTREAVRNTILHEIAHALVGPGHGHDRVWRARAISIGCDGQRCADDVSATQHKWSLDCTSCRKSCAKRLRRSDASKWRSGCCRAPLTWRAL